MSKYLKELSPISVILFQNHLKVLSMWDILLLDIWSTIFTKNPIGTEREKFLKMHQNKAIGMSSRPEVISTPIPEQNSAADCSSSSSQWAISINKKSEWIRTEGRHRITLWNIFLALGPRNILSFTKKIFFFSEIAVIWSKEHKLLMKLTCEFFKNIFFNWTFL